jgi:hypothetical protein
MVLVGLGGSDCEALRDGCLAQPVNSVSSLAYVGAAIAVGIGSLLYHGPMPAGANLAHNASIGALAASIVYAAVQGRLRLPPLPAVGAGALALTIYPLSRTGSSLCRPESLLQGHAAWHVLTAMALASWLGRPVRR